jgi:hypothetical protein
MLEQNEREFVSRIKMALNKMDKTIASYKGELEEGKFRPRNGEYWERTVEKQVVEVATLELRKFTEEESLEEMCRLVDEMEEFVEKARLVDV